MRTKRRYIAFQIIGAARLDRETVLSQILKSHMRFAGEKAFFLSSPWLISFDEENQKGIIRTDLEGMDDLRTSMALIARINGESVIFRTLGVSGTIRACEDRFIRKLRTSTLERVEKRNGEEGPGRLRRIAEIKVLVPGSRIKISQKEFRLKQVFDDGRVDLTSDERSFGFTILDLLESNLGNEGQK